MFVVIYWLLINRRVRHLHLLRHALAWSIKNDHYVLLDQRRKTNNARKYLRRNREISRKCRKYWKNFHRVLYNDKIRKYRVGVFRLFFRSHTYESVTNYSTRSCDATQLLKNVLHFDGWWSELHRLNGSRVSVENHNKTAHRREWL